VRDVEFIAQLHVTLSFAGAGGGIDADPIPGWDRRPLAPVAFVQGDASKLRAIDMVPCDTTRLALAIVPERDLAPGTTWT
jgi:hypothetical protein